MSHSLETLFNDAVFKLNSMIHWFGCSGYQVNSSLKGKMFCE